MTGLLIFLIFMVALYVVAQIRGNRLKAKRLDIEEDIQNFESSISNKGDFDYVFKYRRICVYVNCDKKKIYFYGWEPSEYNFSDIINIEYIYKTHQNFSTRTTSISKKKPAVGKALVGGAVFGPAGAIIGGTSGKTRTSSSSKTTSEEVTDNMMIIIYLKDYGQIELNFLDDEKYAYLNDMDEYMAYSQLSGILNIIEKENNKQNSSGNKKEIGLKKQLKELNELLEEDLINKEEYEERRKKILES